MSKDLASYVASSMQDVVLKRLAAAGLEVVPAGEVERLRAALSRIAYAPDDLAHGEDWMVEVARLALEGTR